MVVRVYTIKFNVIPAILNKWQWYIVITAEVENDVFVEFLRVKFPHAFCLLCWLKGRPF